MIFLKVYPLCTPFSKKQVNLSYVHLFMLLKASKSILTIFKQYFCENLSKLVSLSYFATPKKKDVILPHISVKEIFEEKKGPFWDTHHFDHMDLFFYQTDLDNIYGGRVNTCYFLDFEKFLKKKGKKGYYGHFGTLLDLYKSSKVPK